MASFGLHGYRIKNGQRREGVLTVLNSVKELLSDPKRWTKNSFAKNIYRHDVKPQNPNAVQFCMLGAIQKVDTAFEVQATELLAQVISEHFGRYDIVDFNDKSSTDHPMVLRAIDTAIKFENGEID